MSPLTVGITDELIKNFQENGFAIIPGFLSAEQITQLKNASKEVVKEYCQSSPISIFGNRTRDTYFAESGDKIRGFYEESTVSPDGRLLVENPEETALNKVGHALHLFHPIFHEFTISPTVKSIAQAVTQIEEPLVMQSMVIFKHPRVGAEVKSHQDATFLYCDPFYGKLLGFWIALDEASEENGCLHFLKGSHKNGKVYARFVRNPEKESDVLFVHQGENCPEDGGEWVAAPAKPGDLVLIDGLVIHKSRENTSDKRRMAYTFHVVDDKAKWSAENWLQPTEKGTFVKI